MVERYCGVRLAPCTGLQWRGEALASPLRLGVWPVTAITGISWYDSDGNAVTDDEGGDWRVGNRDTVLLKPGRSLPSGVSAGVVITFDGGFPEGTCPAVLKQAVRMFAAHLNLNRESVITGTIATEIPLGFRDLCARVRMPTI
jgi:uncharacterized phiE125 gp8 family phage protein